MQRNVLVRYSKRSLSTIAAVLTAMAIAAASGPAFAAGDPAGALVKSAATKQRKSAGHSQSRPQIFGTGREMVAVGAFVPRSASSVFQHGRRSRRQRRPIRSCLVPGGSKQSSHRAANRVGADGRPVVLADRELDQRLSLPTRLHVRAEPRRIDRAVPAADCERLLSNAHRPLCRDQWSAAAEPSVVSRDVTALHVQGGSRACHELRSMHHRQHATGRGHRVLAPARAPAAGCPYSVLRIGRMGAGGHLRDRSYARSLSVPFLKRG